MTHWANQYIGLPWEQDTQGPDSYDCWGLLRHVMHTHYGIEIPALTVGEVKAREEFARWSRVKRPEDGDGVLMKQGKSPHVGVWIGANGGACLHSVEGIGVVLSNLDQLRSMGWTPAFYRFSG